jgi:hypothetical protein
MFKPKRPAPVKALGLFNAGPVPAVSRLEIKKFCGGSPFACTRHVHGGAATRQS